MFETGNISLFNYLTYIELIKGKTFFGVRCTLTLTQMVIKQHSCCGNTQQLVINLGESLESLQPLKCSAFRPQDCFPFFSSFQSSLNLLELLS